MKEIRCGQCNKKLAEAIFIELKIKCPRCGTFNSLSARSAVHERHQSVEQSTICHDAHAHPTDQGSAS
ncbi:MAG: Com family DNA-binding transcriptional regulator [Betaproteobacteria bacterium]|nr:Com family DNA-binding transcriptional regulator [Betaproteobacteria bacterium]